ncbi:putative type II secretion system protein K [invertebrate metagenome]|uniref:Putative type II secretion system protein K n=1 Tax=invertebrate metagenome TaxID=1711999 RepID=A0A2H9T5W2_9ZZZZ
MSVEKKQKGIALIYILLIFSIITLMASQIIMSLRLQTEKSIKFVEWIQAKHNAFGAEQYVALLLEDDFDEDKKADKTGDYEREKRNISELNYTVDNGTIDAHVLDEQGFFNLNWLSSNEETDKNYIDMLKRLLLNQFIDDSLVYKIMDWVSAGQTASELGAKDNVYLMENSPHRIPEGPMASVSELRLIEGVNEEIFNLLLPLVTVLPKKNKINLNAAIPELIMSLSDNLSEGDAVAVLEARKMDRLSSIEDLGKKAGIENKLSAFRSEKIGFSSQFFSVYIRSVYGDTTFYLRTLLYRNMQGRMEVVEREIGSNDDWIRIGRSTEA